MQNYQLYSTNIYLGGQMRWDLVLGNETELYIKDFHLSPISDNIPYNKYSKEYLLNYSHQENISSFYKKIEGYFYNTAISPDLKHNWPIISDDTNIKNYDDTYIMGCKRSKDYNLYNKQMEFFVPLWIEQLGKYDYEKNEFIIKPLKFKFSIYTKDIHISTKSLIFKPNGYEYHDKFVKYFEDYIDYLGLKEGNDEVMYVDLSNDISYISGYNIDTRRVIKKHCYSLVDNLTSRERPIMETAGMLIDQFKSSHIITKQLFNFCFHFNIDDILSYDVAKILYGKSFNIRVEVEDTDGDYELCDFYSNFEYIPRQFGGYKNENPDTKKVTLTSEYIYENNYIDFRTVNKFSPQIIHWSLSENPNYIFNLSEGFSGYDIDDNGNVTYYTGQNGIASDNTIDNYIKEKNNARWANMVRVKNGNDFVKIYSYYPESQEAYASSLYGGWVNNIKYKNSLYYDVLLVHVDTEHDNEKEKIYNLCECINEDLYYYIPAYYSGKAYIMLVSSDLNNFTQSNIKRHVTEYNKNLGDPLLDRLCEFFDSRTDPKCIIFDKTIQPTLADGPSMFTSEVEYVKDNVHRSYIFRYDGAIKPTFVKKNNILYYKQVYTNDGYKETPYYKYSNTNYPPLYKTIGYYPINDKNIDYNNYEKVGDYNPMEYKWYNNSINIFLKQNIHDFINSEKDENGNYIGVEDLIKNYFKKIYKLVDDNKVNYIYNLYDIKWDYDYISNDNVKDFKYELKLTLK